MPVTTCTTRPITRQYTQQIQTIATPPPVVRPVHHTTVVQNKPTAPQITVVHMKQPVQKIVVKKRVVDNVDLSDEENTIPVLPIAPPQPPVIGVSQDEFMMMKNEVGALTNALRALTQKFNERGLTMDQRMKVLLDNLKKLELRVFANEKGVQANYDALKVIRDEINLLKSQIGLEVGKIKGAMKGMGVQDLRGVLGALESEIKNSGGINIGDRWRLRFKDDANKDIFLQDRLQKGYYRFRTTKCDRLVKSCKTNDCCCDNNGQNNCEDARC